MKKRHNPFGTAHRRLRRFLPWFATAALLLSGPRGQCALAQDSSFRFTAVKKDVVEDRLRRYVQKNADRQANLKQIFEEAGCGGEKLAEQAIDRRRVPNVICTLPGQSDSTIIVGAHFDHVESGDGVVDNWSGAALLPSLFQSLDKEPRKHTIILIGFSDEEKGLIGSSFYVKKLATEQVAKIQVMVNLDTLGLGPTNVWFTHSDPKLAATLNGLAQAMQLPLAGVNGDKVGDDDSSSFRKRGIPTVMIHSITTETLPILHTARDRIDRIQFSEYYDSYRLIAAYLTYLDATLN